MRSYYSWSVLALRCNFFIIPQERKTSNTTLTSMEQPSCVPCALAAGTRNAFEIQTSPTITTEEHSNASKMAQETLHLLSSQLWCRCQQQTRPSIRFCVSMALLQVKTFHSYIQLSIANSGKGNRLIEDRTGTDTFRVFSLIRSTALLAAVPLPYCYPTHFWCQTWQGKTRKNLLVSMRITWNEVLTTRMHENTPLAFPGPIPCADVDISPKLMFQNSCLKFSKLARIQNFCKNSSRARVGV